MTKLTLHQCDFIIANNKNSVNIYNNNAKYFTLTFVDDRLASFRKPLTYYSIDVKLVIRPYINILN